MNSFTYTPGDWVNDHLRDIRAYYAPTELGSEEPTLGPVPAPSGKPPLPESRIVAGCGFQWTRAHYAVMGLAALAFAGLLFLHMVGSNH